MSSNRKTITILPGHTGSEGRLPQSSARPAAVTLQKQHTITFSRAVIDQIAADIATKEPECGGALLGPLGGLGLVSSFLLDPTAKTTRAAYTPSAKITELVQARELDLDLELKGIVHSHPGAFDKLSRPDIRALRKGLGLNPHLEWLLAPIVTLDRAADPARLNEITLTEQSRMTVYVAIRAASKRVGVLIETPACVLD